MTKPCSYKSKEFIRNVIKVALSCQIFYSRIFHPLYESLRFIFYNVNKSAKNGTDFLTLEWAFSIFNSINSITRQRVCSRLCRNNNFSCTLSVVGFTGENHREKIFTLWSAMSPICLAVSANVMSFFVRRTSVIWGIRIMWEGAH